MNSPAASTSSPTREKSIHDDHEHSDSLDDPFHRTPSPRPSSPELSPPGSKVITDEFGRVRVEEKGVSPIRKSLNPNAVDRSKISPAYVQCFIKHGGHPRTRDQLLSTKVHDAQIHFYAWTDATLKELACVVADRYTERDVTQFRLSFRLFPVTGDPSSPHLAVDMGSVQVLEAGRDDTVTLRDTLFKLGSDLLSIALTPLRPAAAAPTSAPRHTRSSPTGSSPAPARGARPERDRPSLRTTPMPEKQRRVRSPGGSGLRHTERMARHAGRSVSPRPRRRRSPRSSRHSRR